MSDKAEPRRYEEYEGESIDIDFNDDDCIRAIREGIKGLSLPERKIFIMYCEEQTYSAVAKALNCSVPTASKYIREVKNKILGKVDTICKEF